MSREYNSSKKLSADAVFTAEKLRKEEVLL
jgi:hypothetical protein